MNNLTISGRLGRDAETRHTGAGRAVCNFSVAVDRRNGKGEKETQWIDCSLFGERGEKLAPYLTKGTVLSVSGEASARAWMPKNGGDPVGQLCLFVREVTLLGGGERGQNAGHSEQPNQPQSRASTGNQRDIPADNFDDDIPF